MAGLGEGGTQSRASKYTIVPYKVLWADRKFGRTSVYIECSCGAKVEAYVWSLAGSGKRCPGCKRIHGSYGTLTLKEIK